MNLRNWVKQLLRMCGHAFVSTVHDRLNDVDRQLSQIASQLGDLRVAADNLAEADGALLQGGIRTIEELKDLQTEFRRRDAEAKQRLDEVEARWRELLGALQQSLREQDAHLVETVNDRLVRSQQTLFDAVAQLQGALQQSLREQNGHLVETVEDRLVRSHQTLFDAVAQLQGALQQSLREQNTHVIQTVDDRLVRSQQTLFDAVAQLQGALQQSLREQDGHLVETVEDRLARSHQTLFDAVA